jgi:hypothetical protein
MNGKVTFYFEEGPSVTSSKIHPVFFVALNKLLPSRERGQKTTNNKELPGNLC